MHIEAQIPNGLIDYFKTLLLPPDVRIADDGISFDKASLSPYVELGYFTNEPIQRNVGFGKEPIRRGIFQTTVNYAKGEGIIKPYEIAGLIRDHFARGTKIPITGGKIRIDDEPNVSSPNEGNVWVQIPIFINWIVYP